MKRGVRFFSIILLMIIFSISLVFADDETFNFNSDFSKVTVQGTYQGERLVINSEESEIISQILTSNPADSYLLLGNANSKLKIGSLTNPYVRSVGNIMSLGTSASSDLMVLKENQVGIGTTSPGSILEVSDPTSNPTGQRLGGFIASDASSKPYILIGKSYLDDEGLAVAYDSINNYGSIHVAGENIGTALVIADGGSVGIGVMDPGKKLEVLDSIRIRDSTGSAGYSLDFTYGGIRGSHTAWDFGVRDNNNLVNTMTLRSDGNVGIGTIDPNAGLDIYTPNDGSTSLRVSDIGGGGNAVSLLVENMEGTDNFGLVVKSTGHVGIGTDQPEVELHVAGDLKANNLEILENTYLDGDLDVNGKITAGDADFGKVTAGDISVGKIIAGDIETTGSLCDSSGNCIGDVVPHSITADKVTSNVANCDHPYTDADGILKCRSHTFSPGQTLPSYCTGFTQWINYNGVKAGAAGVVSCHRTSSNRFDCIVGNFGDGKAYYWGDGGGVNGQGDSTEILSGKCPSVHTPWGTLTPGSRGDQVAYACLCN